MAVTLDVVALQDEVKSQRKNKGIFMCTLRFHARAGYLQTYETLLKQFSSLPGSDKDPVCCECVTLADRNFNVPCESGIRLSFTDCRNESSTNDVAKSSDVA